MKRGFFLTVFAVLLVVGFGLYAETGESAAAPADGGIYVLSDGTLSFSEDPAWFVWGELGWNIAVYDGQTLVYHACYEVCSRVLDVAFVYVYDAKGKLVAWVGYSPYHNDAVITVGSKPGDLNDIVIVPGNLTETVIAPEKLRGIVDAIFANGLPRGDTDLLAMTRRAGLEDPYFYFDNFGEIALPEPHGD